MLINCAIGIVVNLTCIMAMGFLIFGPFSRVERMSEASRDNIIAKLQATTTTTVDKEAVLHLVAALGNVSFQLARNGINVAAVMAFVFFFNVCLFARCLRYMRSAAPPLETLRPD